MATRAAGADLRGDDPAAKSSARWWLLRRSGATSSPPRRGSFLGDGGAWIWKIHRTFFPTFEPIVDFVHVLTYVYLAAKAIGGWTEAVWQRYLRWATACWQGRVAEVLERVAPCLGGDPPTP